MWWKNNQPPYFFTPCVGRTVRRSFRRTVSSSEGSSVVMVLLTIPDLSGLWGTTLFVLIKNTHGVEEEPPAPVDVSRQSHSAVPHSHWCVVTGDPGETELGAELKTERRRKRGLLVLATYYVRCAQNLRGASSDQSDAVLCATFNSGGAMRCLGSAVRHCAAARARVRACPPPVVLNSVFC